MQCAKGHLGAGTGNRKEELEAEQGGLCSFHFLRSSIAGRRWITLAFFPLKLKCGEASFLPTLDVILLGHDERRANHGFTSICLSEIWALCGSAYYILAKVKGLSALLFSSKNNSESK